MGGGERGDGQVGGGGGVHVVGKARGQPVSKRMQIFFLDQTIRTSGAVKV